MTRADLYARYPKLFPRQVISVGVGWLPLLADLCDYLQGMIDANDSETHPMPQLRFDLLKEKLATFRLHHHWDYKGCPAEDYAANHWLTIRLEGACDYVEHLSASVCEVTGKAGSLYVSSNDESTGWYRTLCAEEAARLGFIPVPPPADCP